MERIYTHPSKWVPAISVRPVPGTAALWQMWRRHDPAGMDPFLDATSLDVIDAYLTANGFVAGECRESP